MKRKRILVIEDSHTVQEIIVRILHKRGWQVVASPSVEDALHWPLAQVMNVVLVDLILPGMGGLAGIPVIRGRWPDIGVVAMSGSADAEAMLGKARKAGAHRLLRKPFSENDLLLAVGELVEEGFGEPDRRERILLIEDSRTVRMFLNKALTAAGYAVVEAGSMEDALGSTSIMSVDLIVSDIFLPGKGGIEGILEIRANWPDVPVIAISGGEGNKDFREDALAAARKIGCAATLRKPFTPDDLIATVRGLLG
jgi:CheY-like chemotaxis protein